MRLVPLLCVAVGLSSLLAGRILQRQEPRSAEILRVGGNALVRGAAAVVTVIVASRALGQDDILYAAAGVGLCVLGFVLLLHAALYVYVALKKSSRIS